MSPSAILALGIGLLGEAAISTWQIASVPVPTRSTSPIENAWAAVGTGRKSRVEGRCFMSVHQTALESQPQQPRTRQRPAWSASKEVRRVLAYAWTLVILSFAFFGARAGVTKSISQKCRSGGGYVSSAYQCPSWSFLSDTGGITSLVAVNAITSFENENSWEPTGRVAAGMAPTVVFILVIQSVLTVGLHCAELPVNISRDEYARRGTYTKGGYKPENSLITVLTSPKSLFLLMLKPLIHWLYDLGFTFFYG